MQGRALAAVLLAGLVSQVAEGQRTRGPAFDGVAVRRTQHDAFAKASGTSGGADNGQAPPSSATYAARLVPQNDSAARSSAWAVLASAAVPGAGQALLGQGRAIAYLALEAYAWGRYAADVRDGRRARDEYRQLASDVARRPFSAVRPVGGFEYYETMEKYVESGAFDAVPGGDLDPEPDTTTANGATWLLARQTYWADAFAPPARDTPEYARAEAFYRERAVRPEYQWSWRDSQLEYAEFRRTIRRSNNAFRESLQNLGVIIANHTLSTVDAFVTIRLRSQPPSARRARAYELTGAIPFANVPGLR